MVAWLPRLWRLLAQLLRANKTWRLPRHSDVLIFDACNHQLLLEYLSPWQPEVLHVRGESFNVPVLIRSLFRGGKRTEAYMDAYVDAVQPRLIATFIDNTERFLALKSRHPGVTTLFIQNGWRGYYADIFETLEGFTPERRQRLHVDRMLTFGDVTAAHYRRHVGGDTTVIGSLKNNMVPRGHRTEDGLMVFLSQWLEEGFEMGGVFYSHDAFFGRIEGPILQCCAAYAREHSKRLLIVPRTRPSEPLRQRETEYFSRLLGWCEFFEPEGMFPSYAAMDAADVVVAVDTTLGYEAIARGKRTAMFSVRSHALGVPGLTYGWPGDFPDDGPFWTNRPDSAGYTRILDYLFDASDERWRRDVESSGFSSLMIHDPGNSLLKSLLERELGVMAQKLAS